MEEELEREKPFRLREHHGKVNREGESNVYLELKAVWEITEWLLRIGKIDFIFNLEDPECPAEEFNIQGLAEVRLTWVGLVG